MKFLAFFLNPDCAVEYITVGLHSKVVDLGYDQTKTGTRISVQTANTMYGHRKHGAETAS